MPTVLAALMKQPDDADEDVSIHNRSSLLSILKMTSPHFFFTHKDWNLSAAAAVCVGLVANTCEDDVIPHVLPFIQANVQQVCVFRFICRTATLI